jgi:anti-anti-sigma factor
MVTPSLSNVVSGGFSLLPEVTSDAICVAMSGNCDMETVPLLESFLVALHAGAIRTGVRRVVFDCDGLFFMNSTSLKLFVTFLAKVKQLGADKYHVHFKTNAGLAWQRRTIESLRRFAPDVVRLD